MIRLYSAIHVGSCWKIQDRRQIKIETIQKLNITQKQQTMYNTKTDVPGSYTCTVIHCLQHYQYKWKDRK